MKTKVGFHEFRSRTAVPVCQCHFTDSTELSKYGCHKKKKKEKQKKLAPQSPVITYCIMRASTSGGLMPEDNIYTICIYR